MLEFDICFILLGIVFGLISYFTTNCNLGFLMALMMIADGGILIGGNCAGL